MSAPPTIYRSDHPDVLAAWAVTQERYREWHEAVGAFAKEYPNHKVVQSRWPTSVSVSGLRGDDSPGECWRFARQRSVWVPDKRTKAGKELYRRISALEAKALGKVPGMPMDVVTNGHWWSHGIHAANGVVWCKWSDDVTNEMVEARCFDGDLWQRAKASEFYVALESTERVEADACAPTAP